MNYYKCNECGQVFSEKEADVVHTTYESMYGVSDLFDYSTPCSYYCCPHCGSDELEEGYRNCYCDEVFHERDFYPFYSRIPSSKFWRFRENKDYSLYCFECWLNEVTYSEKAESFFKEYFNSSEFKDDLISYELEEDFEAVKNKSIEDILRFFYGYNKEFIEHYSSLLLKFFRGKDVNK